MTGMQTIQLLSIGFILIMSVFAVYVGYRVQKHYDQHLESKIKDEVKKELERRDDGTKNSL